MPKQKGSQLKRLKESLNSIGVTRSNKRAKYEKTDRDRLLNQIREENNPFDTHWAKSKHQLVDVKNKKPQKFNAAHSRSREETIRKSTYAKSRQAQTKAGGIIDKRFGEYNTKLSIDEKMQERFSRERIKQSAKNIYNLQDDESFMDDDDDEDVEDEPFSNNLSYKNQDTIDEYGNDVENNFSGDEDDPSRRSKREVMQEVIAKSKFYKQERQKAKDADADIIDELDADFDDFKSMLTDFSGPKTSRINRPIDDISDPNNYDTLVRELAFEKRARPAERTKSEQEIAQEKAAALEQAEEDRQRRMRSIHLEDDDEDSALDGQNLFGKGLTTQSSKVRDSNTNKIIKSDTQALSASELIEDSETIPFTFNCPQNLEDFQDLFSKYSLNTYPIIIDRILTLYDAQIHTENREKLKLFVSAMVPFIIESSTSKTLEMYPDVFSKLSSQLYGLCKTFPMEASLAFRDLMNDINKSSEFVDNQISGREIYLFSLIGKIFPTSDLQHVIATPATLLICQHLIYGSMKSCSEAVAKLKLVAILVSYQRDSRRYIPEILQALAQILFCISPLDLEQSENFIERFAWVEEIREKVDFPSNSPSSVSIDANALLMANEIEDSIPVRNAIINVACGLIKKTVDYYKDLPSLFEVYQPIKYLLGKFKSNVCPENKQVAETLETLDRQISLSLKNRRPLRLQEFKPEAKPLLVPKFEAKYSLDRKSYDSDRSKAEAQKVKALHRSAKRDAMRVLRRDTQFISREKAQEQREKDANYRNRLNKAMNSVTDEK